MVAHRCIMESIFESRPLRPAVKCFFQFPSFGYDADAEVGFVAHLKKANLAFFGG